MAPKKFDFLIDSARYDNDGNIEYVRGFERRGPSFSDNKILTRADLLGLLRDKKVVVTGARIAYMSSTFTVQAQVFLVGNAISDCANSNKDSLAHIPVQ